jgi:hypothetical protein
VTFEVNGGDQLNDAPRGHLFLLLPHKGDGNASFLHFGWAMD